MDPGGALFGAFFALAHIGAVVIVVVLIVFLSSLPFCLGLGLFPAVGIHAHILRVFGIFAAGVFVVIFSAFADSASFHHI